MYSIINYYCMQEYKRVQGTNFIKTENKIKNRLADHSNTTNHNWVSDCSGKTNKERSKTMGCEQSQLKAVDVNLNLEEGLRGEDKVMAVLEEVVQAEDVQQRNVANDQSKENQSGIKSKEKKGKNHSQLEEDGMMKVKKARNYRIKPEHEKFIENIMESNRSKATTEYPTAAQKAPTLKKNSSTPAHPKLDIIQSKSVMNEPVEQKAESTVKEAKLQTKPVLCQKQLERRLNGMLHKIDEEREGGVGLGLDLELLDSSATLQL